MFAVRSKNGQGFRRDGTSFPGDAWLLVDEVTEGQAAEAMLQVLEGVENAADERLGAWPVVNAGAFEEVATSGTDTVDAGAFDATPLTFAELKAIAAERGIAYKVGMSRAKLEELLA